jgi:hypothetical protein
VGVNPLTGNTGICELPDSGVQSSLLATLASQIGGPPITTYPVGSTASAMATSTGSPTENGGQGTVTLGGAGSTSTSTGSPGSGSGSSSGSGINATVGTTGLSIGAIIGIAVAGVCIILLLLIATRICCRYQRSRTYPRHPEPYPVGAGYKAGYTNPGYAAQQTEGYEVDGLQVGGNGRSRVPVYTPIM